MNPESAAQEDPDRKVYVFHGTGSRFANAVFSSVESAAAWIKQHSLTGLLTAYYIDDPGFERARRGGYAPSYIRGSPPTERIQWYVDGSEHYHFVYGIGEDSEDFNDASDRWHADHGHQ
jgi:hypothetical protein